MCGGYLLVLATVLRCRTLHILVNAKSPKYILLLNIFSPRVTRVTLVPCLNTTQLAKRRNRRSLSEATRSHPACAKLPAKKMATASTPARSPRASQEVDAPSSRPPSQQASHDASLQLDKTVRYSPPEPLHLVCSGGARDASSLTDIARQITASRAPHSAPSSQSSSFVALRPSQAGSTVELAGRAAPRAHRPSPSPSRTHSSRSSYRAEHAGEVLLQMSPAK